jgi:hypothetical protein
MDRSYPFSRRIEQRVHFRRRALAATSAGIAACAVAYGMLPAQAPYAPLTLESGMAALQPMTVPVSDPLPMARRVYRYSVVPGGAADRAELERILRTDKVVAAHYAGFEVARARAVTVSAPRAVYVSYRKGDRIYWTSRKVMLQVGETLLTDGRNEMRARCANRISDVPRFPVEPHAPNPDELDEPVDATEGELTLVNAPEPDVDPPELTGQPFKLVWPANSPPTDSPRPGRRPFGNEPAPGLPWPQTGWLGSASIPPLARATPGDRLLASNTPPPLSRAITVLPEPGDSVPGMPPPVTDIDPFVPRPDPSQPATPSNPPLDEQQPADVPEPASTWLFAGALLAMLVRRKRR